MLQMENQGVKQSGSHMEDAAESKETESSGVHTGLTVSFQSFKKSWDWIGHDHPFLLSTHLETGFRRRSKSTGHMGPRTTMVGI